MGMKGRAVVAHAGLCRVAKALMPYPKAVPEGLFLAPVVAWGGGCHPQFLRAYRDAFC